MIPRHFLKCFTWLLEKAVLFKWSVWDFFHQALKKIAVCGYYFSEKEIAPSTLVEGKFII